MGDFLEERLNATRTSIDVWRADVALLSAAESGSANSGLVDANNLVRAGEVLRQIEMEAQVLQHLVATAKGPPAAEIRGLIAELEQLDASVKATSRSLHGLT